MKRKFSFVSMPAAKTDGTCAPILAGLAGKRHGRALRAFTLVELLTVIAIMVLMIAAAGPVASSISGGRDVSTNAYNISGALEEARTYAMANNTYTWVGVAEENGDSSTAGATGVGRIIMTAIASLDGTKDALGDPTRLALISRLTRCNSVQLISTKGAAGDTTWPTPDNGYQAADTSFVVSGKQFKYPLTGTAIYTFNKLIQFNPLGEASKPGASPSPWIAIGFRQIRGSDGSKGNDANGVGVYVEGLSGRVRIFRK